jgi:hypothetical protein
MTTPMTVSSLQTAGLGGELEAERAQTRERDDTLKDVVVMYHGCWAGVGHHLHMVDGYRPKDPAFRAWEMRANSPSRFISNGMNWQCKRKLPGISPETEGFARVTHVMCDFGKEWTVLGFWDRMVDTRYNSWSMFIATGTHDFDTMVQLAKRDFPHIWQRITFEVVQEPTPNDGKQVPA